MKRKEFGTIIFFNSLLGAGIALALVLDFFKTLPYSTGVFIGLSFIGVVPVLWSALRAVFKKELTVDLLASIALLFAFLAREWQSATFILLMITSARIFDFWTERRSQRIIEQLFKYRPTKVKIKIGEEIKEIPLEHIKRDDLVVVEAGERISVDGAVVTGLASVDEAILTGESEPVAKKPGDKVWSSTLNVTGSLLVRAERIGEDSTLSRIVLLIEEASRKKAKTERLAAKFTSWYIVATFVAAIIIYAVTQNLLLILAVLLVVCADDISVAVPLAYSVGIVRAAQAGIVLKGSDVLEKLPKIQTFLTDKTGTLTFGKPKVQGVVTFAGTAEKDFLELIGMAEINSNHPMAVATENFLKEKKIHITAPDDFEETPGFGIMVKKGDRKIFAGKLEYLEINGIKINPEEKKSIEAKKDEGASIMSLGMDGRFLGFIYAEDRIRPYARSIVAATKEAGVKRWIMLTGDNEKVAAKVAADLGIANYVANMKPEGKLEEIEKIKAKHNGIMGMIGDGVNDAAALALADVSIAMGAIGSDAAIEAADVALMRDDLRGVPEAMGLGRETKKIIWQNFVIWVITNATGLVLVLTGVLRPEGAATYNFLTDFVPILNAFRVRVPRLKVVKPIGE
jgi:heavy metal translocating P-type ATPase